jgi:hypothetical protein
LSATRCGVVAFAISNLEYYHNPDKYPSTYLSSAILPIALAVLTGYIVAQVRSSRGAGGRGDCSVLLRHHSQSVN